MQNQEYTLDELAKLDCRKRAISAGDWESYLKTYSDIPAGSPVVLSVGFRKFIKFGVGSATLVVCKPQRAQLFEYGVGEFENVFKRLLGLGLEPRVFKCEISGVGYDL
ncbi:MAG: hypothetical protein IBX55_15980 [Methyloprofundus sp.]|nr:hypothetical protein [Methyloprofundus sp.]